MIREQRIADSMRSRNGDQTPSALVFMERSAHNGDNATEGRFRRLFFRLDAENSWNALLPTKALNYVRRAAENNTHWEDFMMGNAPSTISQQTPLENQRAAQPDNRNQTEHLNGDLTSMEIGENHQEEQKSTAKTSPTPKSSPREKNSSKSINSNPTVTNSNNPSAEDIAQLSAMVRRRLAIESVEDQFFHGVYGALPIEDERYERDVGMLDGDDGGYAKYEDLLQEETEAIREETSVYKLLGSNEEDAPNTIGEDMNGASSPRLRRNSTPKRPRRPSLGLSEQMETFVRGLRELCEPLRDAAKIESEKSKDVPKNIHRKAVSAANVVDELKDVEMKVHIGKIDRVEECIATVSARIQNQDETFKDVLSQIEERAAGLREEHRIRKNRLVALNKLNRLATGVLGTCADHNDLVSFDDDEDEEMADPNQNATLNGGTSVPTEHVISQRQVKIPFSETDLMFWPSLNTGVGEIKPTVPQVPIFLPCESNKKANDDGKEGENCNPGDHVENSLVDILGEDHIMLKNVFALRKLRRTRNHAVKKYAYYRSRASASREAAKAKPNGTAKNPAVEAKVKPEPQEVSKRITSSNPTSRHVPAGGVPKRQKEQPREKQNLGNILDIRNDAHDNFGGASSGSDTGGSRYDAMGRAVVGLMLAHEGFDTATPAALDVLTHVMEDFLFKIGSSLSSCRENIDRPMAPGCNELPRLPADDELYEQLNVICEAGFRGHFAQLDQYMRADIPRMEQSLRDANVRLEASIAKIDLEMKKLDVAEKASHGEKKTRQVQPMGISISDEEESIEAIQNTSSSIVLDENAFLFGHLKPHVTLDVLGPIRVPMQLAKPFGNTPTSGGAHTSEEDKSSKNG